MHVKVGAESQLQVAIGKILELVSDKNANVSDTAVASLKKISEKHPNQVLNCCSTFCTKTPKPSAEHIGAILGIMEGICDDHILSIDGDTVVGTIEFCLSVMIENVYPDPTHRPASSVLVAISRKHHVQVIDSLLEHLKPSILPHYMIPHTIGAMASINAQGVVPYLKCILSTMLPLMSGIRNDTLKQSLSYAIGNFCDALLEYVTNAEQVPDDTIKLEDFQAEMGTAYEIFVTQYLQTKDTKMIECVLTAIASVFPVLSVDKVTQHTSKLVHTLLNLYKKAVDAFYVTRCFGAVIKKAANVDGTLLEPLLGNILQVLSDIVCPSPDYAKPNLPRSHSEALRCYECIALHFTDSTIDQLILQLKNNNDKEKIKGLLIITHLTSYSSERMIERRLKDIMKHISDILCEGNIEVKKALLKITVAFACRGILLNKEINPDGPEKYVEFILKLCCTQSMPKNNDVNMQELQDLQKSADNILWMLTTSVGDLEPILWILLSRALLDAHYEDAIVVLVRCLTHLASEKSSPPICEESFIKCMALLAIPLPAFRGKFILNFLKNIRPCETDSYKSVWDQKIPQLMKYLEQNYDHFNSMEWHDLVLDFLVLLLETIKDEKYIELLIVAARKQLGVYNIGQHTTSATDLSVKQTEKQFLLKCFSILLCHTQNKDLVLQSLDNILVNVRLTDFSELHACAAAVGICSRSHLQLVLDKLAIIRKDITLKKPNKFLNFSFIKDQKHDIGVERLRYVIIFSYAEICNEGPSTLLLKVIESEILEFVLNELQNCKDFSTKKACLRAIGAVADAMHPNRNSLHIRMQSRDDVLKLVSSQIQLHNGPEYIELLPLVLPVVTSLVKLPSVLESDRRLQLLKHCFDSVYNASAIYCKINPESKENYYGGLKMVPYVVSSFTKLNQLVQELLMQSLSPATVDEIVTLLESWLSRKKAEQRLPAVETLRLTLQTYLDNMKFAYDCPSSFGQTGGLLSRVVPRCTDPNSNIRKVAVECLCLILCIASRYEGKLRDFDKLLSNSVQYIQQQIESEDPKLLYNLTADLAHIICVNIPHFQLSHFVSGLLDALLDCEPSSSYGSSIVLNLTLKNKGTELQTQVSDLVFKLIGQLDLISCSNTKVLTLRSVQNLASHHPKVVGGILLQQPLPYAQSICECWTILSTDPTLASELLDQLKKVIKQTPAYEEQGELKVVTLAPLQAICALHEILKNQQLKELCIQQFSELFSLLLITLASYIGAVSPEGKNSPDKREKYSILHRASAKLAPAKIALDTFRLFLLCCEYDAMAGILLACKDIEDNHDSLLEAIAQLVESISAQHPQYIAWMVGYLGPCIRAELEPQRLAVVAFLVNLIKFKANEQVLAENLLEMILDVQLDLSPSVKTLGIQGLGYAAENLHRGLISRHCNSILGVLMNSLDYSNIGNESAVILEGMLSFSKLLFTLRNSTFGSCQVTAAVRIKPLLTHEDPRLRKASIRLLGDLTESVTADTNLEAFQEQIHGNMVTLLLHLCDPDPEVIKASKYTLRKIGPKLSSPRVDKMIQEHLIEEANLHYSDFMRDLVKVMEVELQEFFPVFIMTCLIYTKSSWVEIRSNAALLLGLLFSLLSEENRKQVSIDTVCDKLMRLLNDEQEEVRIKAVQALPSLFVN